MPNDKANAVADLNASEVLAFVGKSVNEAPVLAASDVAKRLRLLARTIPYYENIKLVRPVRDMHDSARLEALICTN